MARMEEAKLRIAICGGGIGGLSLACALMKHPSISFTVFESSTTFSPFKGAGVGMWPRAWSILEEIGLSEDLEKVASNSSASAGEPISFALRKSDQEKGRCFLRITPEQGRMISFYRPQFQETLLQRVPSRCIRFSKCLVFYSRDKRTGRIVLYFRDGSTDTCDVLVGADGLKSPTRACLYRELVDRARASGSCPAALAELESVVEPEYTGTVVYRAIVEVGKESTSPQLPPEPTMYLGRNATIVVYPVGNEGIVNLSLYRFWDDIQGSKYQGPWSEPVHSDEVYTVSSFENWEPDAQEWLKCFHNPTKWAVHTVKTLPTFAAHHVVLLGDAAHAYAPHQGVGAGQAIEDAYVLAELLGHPSITLHTVSRALEVYDGIRRPWANEVAKRCQFNGRCYGLHFDNFPFENASPCDTEQKLDEMGDRLLEGWDWCWRTSVRHSLDDALRKLRDWQ
ncbi:hypothetical protein V5O48_004445 [Marasmius crinis-equi]|uniref:FAD-binding domain-containing protein n=1 Tax=Marasmius crinis-equi TaxID=585013 RepID=A0ABR3FR19_9AGAR